MAKITTPAEFTYEGWASLLGLADEKRIGHNTRLVRTGAGVAIVLHTTPVVLYDRDGWVALSFGGWPTVTTRDRINQALPPGFRVFQRDHAQYLARQGLDPIPLPAWGQVCVVPAPAAEVA